jgi:hypothetical protein
MQLIPVLDGSNYLPWAHTMTAYLKSQGLWGIVNGTERYPTDPNAPKTTLLAATPTTSTYTVPKEIEEAQKAYWLKNDAAIGTLMLRLTPAIADMCSVHHGTDDIWNHLNKEYSTPSLSYAYQQFRIAMNFKIDTTCVTTSCAGYFFPFPFALLSFVSFPFTLSSSAFAALLFPFDFLAYLLTCFLLVSLYYHLPCCARISSPFLFPLPTLLCTHLLTVHLCIIAPSVRASLSWLHVYYHTLYACLIA